MISIAGQVFVPIRIQNTVGFGPDAPPELAHQALYDKQADPCTGPSPYVLFGYPVDVRRDALARLHQLLQQGVTKQHQPRLSPERAQVTTEQAGPVSPGQRMPQGIGRLQQRPQLRRPGNPLHHRRRGPYRREPGRPLSGKGLQLRQRRLHVVWWRSHRRLLSTIPAARRTSLAWMSRGSSEPPAPICSKAMVTESTLFHYTTGSD